MRDLKAKKPAAGTRNRMNKPKRERKLINFGPFLRWTRRVVLWSGGAACAFLMIVGVYRLASQVVFFRLDRIEIVNNRRLTAEDIITISGIRRGDDLFRLDLGKIGGQLAKNPWIGGVQVRRHFPHTLTINVSEREPVGVVNLGFLYYLDTSGEIFKPLTEGDPLDYPVITGVTEEDLSRDRAGSAEALKNAASLVAMMKSAAGFLDNVSEIHYDKGFGFTIFTTERGVPVKLGNDGFSEKLARFARIYPQLQPQMAALEYIDLNYSDKIVVKKV